MGKNDQPSAANCPGLAGENHVYLRFIVRTSPCIFSLALLCSMLPLPSPLVDSGFIVAVYRVFGLSGWFGVNTTTALLGSQDTRPDTGSSVPRFALRENSEGVIVVKSGPPAATVCVSGEIGPTCSHGLCEHGGEERCWGCTGWGF